MPGKMNDPDTIPEKIMESGGDAGEDEEIRASIEKDWIRVSIEKGRIKASVRKVESGSGPKKGNPSKFRTIEIQASTGKCRIRVSTGKVKSG